MPELRFGLEYEWEPFSVAGEQLTFQQLAGRQLLRNECSHWGAAIFKWEGLITASDAGGRTGALGVSFGQTDDISRRIQEHAAATRPSHPDNYVLGFLLSGDIRLFILKPLRDIFPGKETGLFSFPGSPDSWISMPKKRKLIAELVMLECASHKPPYVWLVNRFLDS